MRVVFVENHDSFSANVLALLPVPPEAVRVVHAPAALDALAGADALVIGPGPGEPVQAGLVEVVRAAAGRGLPTLGICLGHQALGLAFGATLGRSTPAHGTPAEVRFTASRSFPGFEGPLTGMRYHSLSLSAVQPPLEVVAALADGTVMAVEHRTLPLAGLQFHPDSFATPRGRALVEAFFRAHLPGAAWRARPREQPPRHVPAAPGPAEAPAPLPLSGLDGAGFALLGPGFSPGAGWTLLTELEPRAGEEGAELVLLEAEDRRPRFFAGRRQPVAPGFDVAPLSLQPALDEAAFLAGVEAVRAAVARGDVYQVNLTQRVALGPAGGAQLLATLCRRAVPRFPAWARLPGAPELVAASPELLFELHGRRLRAEPMKGTAPAGARAALEASAKDAAELAMITDLLRDDLHALCEPGSVEVPAARRYLELPYAVQAVSDVAGTLRPGLGVAEVLARLHPGGSVTGAPREAALAHLGRLEATLRGPYCGTLGLRHRDGWRCALLIRTAFRRGDGWVLGVGNGITWASDARAELEELKVKLGMLR